MTAINHNIRADIANAVLKHGFADKLTILMATEHRLAPRAYARLYDKATIAALELLKEKWSGSTGYRTSLAVNVGGAKIIIGRSDRGVSTEPMAYLLPPHDKLSFIVPYGHQHGDYANLSLEADDELGIEIMEYGLARDALNEAIKVKRAEVMGVLMECRSDRQLRDRWPEVMPLAEPFLRSEPKTQLPAIPTVDLNASLGLPPMKKAA